MIKMPVTTNQEIRGKKIKKHFYFIFFYKTVFKT